MRINAHEPRPARFVIGVRASARHIVPGYNIARGLGIAFTPQTFVEDVIHAASQADIFRHIPGRAQADDAVRADFTRRTTGYRFTP